MIDEYAAERILVSFSLQQIKLL